MHQFLDEKAEEGGYLGCSLLPRIIAASLLSHIRTELKYSYGYNDKTYPESATKPRIGSVTCKLQTLFALYL